MRKPWLLAAFVLITLLSIVQPGLAITGKNYDTSINCGDFECADWLVYYNPNGGLWPTTLSATGCADGKCAKFDVGNALQTGGLETFTDANNYRVIYIGADTQIEFDINSTGNLTAIENFWFRIYDITGMTSYTIAAFNSSWPFGANYTTVRWINGINGSVPTDYYRLAFYLNFADEDIYIDNLNITTVPDYFNFTVGVVSESEVINGTTCMMQIEDATVTVDNVTNTSATLTNNITGYCNYNGVSYDLRQYWFNVTGGRHIVTVEKPSYKTFTDSFDVLDNTWLIVPLEKTGYNALTVVINNVTGYYPTATVTLFHNNGTQYASIHGDLDANPRTDNSGGYGFVWYQVPDGQYYAIVESVGYIRYKSPLFLVSGDKTVYVTLAKSSYTITLSADTLNGTATDSFDFSADFTGFTTPIYNLYLTVKKADGTTMTETRVAVTTEYNFTLGSSYFSAGVNEVYISSGLERSNSVFITITKGVTGVVETPLIEFPTQLSFVGLLLTPQIIFMGALAAIGYLFEQASHWAAKGKMFLGTLILGTVMLTYVGILPVWVGVVISLLCAVVLYFTATGINKQ